MADAYRRCCGIKENHEKEKIDPDIANEKGTVNIIYDSSR
jgi:hypothetical protein